MRVSILRTSATSLGASNPLVNWLSGLATEIDFDSVASGTVIDTAYTGSGVTFSSNAGSVYASDGYDTSDADSPPNVITISKPPQAAGFDESGGWIRANFTTPQLFVSIDAHPIFSGDDPKKAGTNTPYLKIFGVPIVLPPPINQGPAPLLAWFNFPLSSMDPNYQSWHTISYVSLSPTPNIGSVVFSSSHSGTGEPVYALFDRLRFAHQLPITGIWEKG